MRQPRHRPEHVPRPRGDQAPSLLDEPPMEIRARETLASLSVRTVNSVRQHVASLSGGQRQTVAIAKAVLWNSKLVLLDEPTAALGVAQTRQVLDLVRRLADRGLGVVLISHNMTDVFEVADRITALYLGRVAADVPAKDVNHSQIVELITAGRSGRPRHLREPRRPRASEGDGHDHRDRHQPATQDRGRRRRLLGRHRHPGDARQRVPRLRQPRPRRRHGLAPGRPRPGPAGGSSSASPATPSPAGSTSRT